MAWGLCTEEVASGRWQAWASARSHWTPSNGRTRRPRAGWEVTPTWKCPPHPNESMSSTKLSVVFLLFLQNLKEKQEGEEERIHPQCGAKEHAA